MSPQAGFSAAVLIVISFVPATGATKPDRPKRPAPRKVELRANVAQPPRVTTVSAASYGAEVAPGEIVAAFGVRLATQTVIATDADPNTPGIQLPADLGGTTVEVNGRHTGLFFVSPTQINYLMPPAQAACWFARRRAKR